MRSFLCPTTTLSNALVDLQNGRHCGGRVFRRCASRCTLHRSQRELGTKLQRRWILVTYTVRRGVQSVIYPGLGDFSDWDENSFPGYANLVRITPRYTLEGGLRLEETQVSYTIPAENIYYPGSDR